MEEKKFLDLLDKELMIALGCTEPIAIAFVAALARKHVMGKVIKVKVNASCNIIKNAMSVCIPGTNSCGINLAAALGVIKENPGKKTQITGRHETRRIGKCHRNGKNGLSHS